MSDVFRALAEPNRREILSLIRSHELPAGEIAEHFEVSRSAVSQHLKILVEAGLATVRRERTSRLYLADREGLLAVRRFLEDFWDDSLAGLKQEAEAEERRSRMERGGS